MIDGPADLPLSSYQLGWHGPALREEFGDSAFKSRQDILAGESRVFAEQLALGGFAEDGCRAGLPG